jgi:hypothetical protein
MNKKVIITKIKKNMPVLSFFTCYRLLLTGEFKKLYLIISRQTFFHTLFSSCYLLDIFSDTLLFFPVIRHNSFYSENKNEYIYKLAIS